ncbi:MAG: alkaline phosphatase D family protein [Betaproteobacteria bacterium]
MTDRHSTFPLVARIILTTWLVLAMPASAKLTVMHGYADYTSALLWVMADAPGPIEISWQPDAQGPERKLKLDAAAATGNVVHARLTGLTPGKSAAYRVSGDNDIRSGMLAAQPHWSKPADAADLAIAIGSCFFLADADPMWGGQSYGGGFEIFDSIAAIKPDLMIWMGDSLYFQAPDELDPDSMAMRYQRQRTFLPLQKLLTTVPHIATWDDHDYGPNDHDMSYVMKGESLQLFRRYWANPSYGLPDVPGVFGWSRWGDVEIFLLDDRWYRSANHALDTPDKTMFGAQQLTWLRNALTHSRAPVKLVVNGSQMWNRANRFEGWTHYAFEQKAFADWLVAQRIDGVVFLSGDRHFTELLKIDRPGTYPLYEFTSSPLTSRPWGNPEAGERYNPDLVPGTLVGQRQFGMIRVTGPGGNRSIALESYDTAGKLLWRKEIRANDLKSPKAAGNP